MTDFLDFYVRLNYLNLFAQFKLADLFVELLEVAWGYFILVELSISLKFIEDLLGRFALEDQPNFAIFQFLKVD